MSYKIDRRLDNYKSLSSFSIIIITDGQLEENLSTYAHCTLLTYFQFFVSNLKVQSTQKQIQSNENHTSKIIALVFCY